MWRLPKIRRRSISLDKKTLATIRRINCTRGKPVDLAIHPARPLSYVTIVQEGQQGNGSFVVVDEQSGEFRDAKEYLGQSIEIDAAGQRLVTAGTFNHLAGSELLIVPRRGPGLPPPSPAVPHPGPGGPPLPYSTPSPHRSPHGGQTVDVRVARATGRSTPYWSTAWRTTGHLQRWDLAVRAGGRQQFGAANLHRRPAGHVFQEQRQGRSLELGRHGRQTGRVCDGNRTARRSRVSSGLVADGVPRTEPPDDLRARKAASCGRNAWRTR